jgi:hypothetical protein
LSARARSSARARDGAAEKTRASNQKLLNEKFISQTAFDGSQSGLDVAKGNVRASKAQVKLAENALRDCGSQRADRGRGRQAPRAAGREVAFDAPLVTVLDLSDLELQALVRRSTCPAWRSA